MEYPILSIIIPVYNVERYIDQCLSSICNGESYGESFEIIVVNDGTQDDSMKIVGEYAERYENIKIIHEENQGLSVARNTGLEAAKGSYIWFVDSDDWVDVSAVSILGRLIKQYPNIEVFVLPAMWEYEDTSRNWVDMKIADTMIMTGKDYLHSDNPIATWHFVMKKSVINTNHISFYPHILHEDCLWGHEFLYFVQNMMLLTHPFIHYRQREGSIMGSISIKNGYDIIKIHKLLLMFCDKQVEFSDRIWYKKIIIMQLPASVHKLWHLRHTLEFKKFLDDTKEYRFRVLDECIRFGGWRWKLKCRMMKFPIAYEHLRLLKNRIIPIVKKVKCKRAH